MDSNALKDEFLIESFDNLSSISEDITHLEKDPSNKELLNKVYRSVHTLKGSASFLGYKSYKKLLIVQKTYWMNSEKRNF